MKFDGLNAADDIINEKKFSGNLFYVLSELDSFLEYVIINQKPVPVSALKEKTQFNFPKWAIRELLMNAVMHRDYESNAPIRFYQYADRIEIINPGGLYGNARPENFPNVNDYRNPVIAEAMKVLGYVNRYNRGISMVKRELKENGNPDAVFDYKNIGVFGVTVLDVQFDKDVVEKSSEKSSEKILNLIKENTEISADALADIIGISSRAVEKHLSKFKERGILKRIGPDKGGHWEVVDGK